MRTCEDVIKMGSDGVNWKHLAHYRIQRPNFNYANENVDFFKCGGSVE
jgi:hypothetical protein